MNYRIIIGDSLSGLEKNVNDFISSQEQTWIPVGGPMVDPRSGMICFVQAVMRGRMAAKGQK